MSDGTRLSALIWLPGGASEHPVPAILEYIPYRKRDGTRERDAEVYPYIAGHGYAGVRVDIRGSGDSEGVLLGEYLKQEEDDALEVIEWLADQPWCSGNVGMIGLSWGGNIALQVAARRPPALRAIISVCSSDDRYNDDIHMFGGCLLTDKFESGARMLPIYTSPPDPDLVGDRWRDMWFDRLEHTGLWVTEWHEHLRRDWFYKHTSICEDYSAIQCATYLVGGWADPFCNAIFRMMVNLECPRKALIGPWAHRYPSLGAPGPAIGFLQESIRWWDHWLKGRETKIMEEPMLRCWMRSPEQTPSSDGEWCGRWVAEPHWPATHMTMRSLYFGPGKLTTDASSDASEVTIQSLQTAGHTMGSWYPLCIGPDLPDDQRYEIGHSSGFDGEPLEYPIEILGAPLVHLDVIPDDQNGFVVAVLSDVFPDGSATMVSFGALNLTHRHSDELPEELQPGQRYGVTLRLNEIAHRFGAGNRIRLALSTSFWPIVWPSPRVTTLRLLTDTSRLELPVRRAQPVDDALVAFGPPEAGVSVETVQVEPPDIDWTLTRDLETGRQSHRRYTDTGLKRFDDGWEYRSVWDTNYEILPNDPLSARVQLKMTRYFGRNEWQLRTLSTMVMMAARSEFVIRARLECYEGDERVFAKSWNESVPRDFV